MNRKPSQIGTLKYSTALVENLPSLARSAVYDILLSYDRTR